MKMSFYISRRFVLSKNVVVHAIVLLIVCYQIFAVQSLWQLFWNRRAYAKFGETTVKSDLGWVSYDTLNYTIYRDFGYYIKENSIPVPTLEYYNPLMCNNVFYDWLLIAQSDENKGPIEEIPKEMLSRFTMMGYSTLYKKYQNRHYSSTPRLWNMVEAWAALLEDQLPSISNYGQISMGLYYGLKHFPPTNQKGLVVGSLTPWAEAFALKLGAQEVLTLEYQEIEIVDTERVKYMHPLEFAKTHSSHQESFDFAITFSSLEHSGLGRYGDVLDPIGDLREVQKIACSLKKGGLLYIGFPRGRDALTYNLHRIYGRIRLAMIMTGFDWLATFRGSSSTPVETSLDDLDGTNDSSGAYQDLFVLRKR